MPMSSNPSPLMSPSIATPVPNSVSVALEKVTDGEPPAKVELPRNRYARLLLLVPTMMSEILSPLTSPEPSDEAPNTSVVPAGELMIVWLKCATQHCPAQVHDPPDGVAAIAPAVPAMLVASTAK